VRTRFTLRRSARDPIAPLLLIIVVFLPYVLSGCGDGGDTASTASASGTGRVDKTAGAEQSIEGFGAEAVGSDRRTILRVERSYFAAIAAKRYAVACSILAGRVRHSIANLAGSGQDGSCPQVVPALLAPQAYATAREQARATVRRVRVKGGQAFIVFHAPGARLYQLPLTYEKAEWKVGLLVASVLAPSLSTLHASASH
jgi:hypothetical protein